MYRKISAAAAIICFPLFLGGCTVEEIVAGTVTACKFAPTAETVYKVVTAITGQPPGVGVGVEVTQQAVKVICAAATAYKPGTRSLVYIRANGQRIPLEGSRVP